MFRNVVLGSIRVKSTGFVTYACFVNEDGSCCGSS